MLGGVPIRFRSIYYNKGECTSSLFTGKVHYSRAKYIRVKQSTLEAAKYIRGSKEQYILDLLICLFSLRKCRKIRKM